MTTRRLDETLAALPINEDGKVEGFQFEGKARRLQSWREKKEDLEFRKLCLRVYQAHYQRRYYQEKPHVRAASKKRLIERRRKLAAVRVCLNCGVEWINVPGLQRGGKPPTRYCTKRCRVQYHNRALVQERKRTGFWKTNWKRWRRSKTANSQRGKR